MFYDERGKHRRTKKEILDENGNIRKKCKVIKKGEVYERNLFTKKNELFKADGFLDEVKHLYTDLINICAIKEEDKLHMFDRNGMYLATKKIGKNNPKAAEIEADAILMAKKFADGVYDSDPKTNPNAVKFDELTYNDIITKELKVMDATSTTLCKDNNIPIIVFSMDIPGNITKAAKGEEIGTIVRGE